MNYCGTIFRYFQFHCFCLHFVVHRIYIYIFLSNKNSLKRIVSYKLLKASFVITNFQPK